MTSVTSSHCINNIRSLFEGLKCKFRSYLSHFLFNHTCAFLDQKVNFTFLCMCTTLIGQEKVKYVQLWFVSSSQQPSVTDLFMLKFVRYHSCQKKHTSPPHSCTYEADCMAFPTQMSLLTTFLRYDMNTALLCRVTSSSSTGAATEEERFNSEIKTNQRKAWRNSEDLLGAYFKMNLEPLQT